MDFPSFFFFSLSLLSHARASLSPRPLSRVSALASAPQAATNEGPNETNPRVFFFFFLLSRDLSFGVGPLVEREECERRGRVLFFHSFFIHFFHYPSLVFLLFKLIITETNMENPPAAPGGDADNVPGEGEHASVRFFCSEAENLIAGLIDGRRRRRRKKRGINLFASSSCTISSVSASCLSCHRGRE